MQSYTISVPSGVKPLTELFLLALCIYREARGEATDAKRGVASVVKNRTLRPSWWGNDWFTVITKPWQFSSFNKGEPNSVVWGSPTDTVWNECIKVAFDTITSNYTDPTNGATFYYDKSLDKPGSGGPPLWASKYILTCQIGAFKFFKDKE